MILNHYRIMRLSGLSAAKHRGFHPIILELETEDGLRGLGEACTVIGGNSRAVIEALREFAAVLMGREAEDVPALRSRLAKRFTWLSNPGIILGGALSAVDTALWDLKARAAGVPLYQLLGEKQRDLFPAYASQLQFGWGSSLGEPRVTAEQLAGAAAEAVSQGYRVLKFDPMGYDPAGRWKGLSLRGRLDEETLSLIEARAASVRQAVGEEVGLILENHCLTDAESAAQLAERLKDLHFLMMEEPVEPLQMEGLPLIKTRCDVPLAMGEKLASPEEFAGPLRAGTMDIAQPDIGICGGVSALMQIARMAQAQGVPVTAHCCHSPVSTAATLHCEAVLPNFLLHEVHATAAIEENIALCEPRIAPENGFFRLPEGIGLGVEITEKARREAELIYTE